MLHFLAGLLIFGILVRFLPKLVAAVVVVGVLFFGAAWLNDYHTGP